MTVEAFTEEPRSSQMPPSAPRSFPGGTVKLPRLNNQAKSSTQFAYVGTAFVRATADDSAPINADDGAFTEYFTPESLFAESLVDNEEEQIFSGEDPYEVLRVERDAPWSVITRAHRSLVKEFHPDRFVDFADSIVEEAEIEIRRINTAYTSLRKTHPGATSV